MRWGGRKKEKGIIQLRKNENGIFNAYVIKNMMIMVMVVGMMMIMMMMLMILLMITVVVVVWR